MTKSTSLIFILSFITLISFTNQRSFTFPFTTERIPSSTLVSFLQIPQAVVKDSGLDRDCIEACFGTPPQCFKLIIQSGSFYIWVVDSKSQQKAANKFDPSKSSTLERNMTQVLAEYSGSSVTGYQGKDFFYIDNQKIAKINFLISKKSDSFTEYEGMIGLGYTPASYEEKFSLIEQLYKEKVIFHRVFTQSFTTSGRGEISFGEIPKHIVDDYKNYGRCQALDKIREDKKFKNKNWQCELNGVYYGKTYSEFVVKKLENAKVSFFSYRRRVLIPMKFFDYLGDTYFRDLLEKDICEIVMLKRYDTYLCNSDYIPDTDLNFIFGEWAMRIPADKLFKMNKKKNKLEFILYHKKDYEKFTLGRPIVRLFHMVYDFQNEQIGFYDKENVVRIATTNPVKPKIYTEIKDEQGPSVAPKIKIKPTSQGTENIPDIEEGEVKANSGLSFNFSSILKTLLIISIVCVVVFLIGLGAYSYLKYRKKSKLKSSFAYNSF